MLNEAEEEGSIPAQLKLMRHTRKVPPTKTEALESTVADELGVLHEEVRYPPIFCISWWGTGGLLMRVFFFVFFFFFFFFLFLCPSLAAAALLFLNFLHCLQLAVYHPVVIY
jgi:hypothetical protein